MTRHFQVAARDFDPEALREPAAILREGGLVAFPTETVYGIGVNARRPEAIERLIRLKGRSDDKPFSYHLASVSQVEDIAGSVPPQARILLDRYAPGPITLVIPARRGGSQAMVGVRIPASELARKLIALVGEPLLVPSANPAGAPPAISAEEVRRYFPTQLDAIVDGGTVLLKQSSTVVRVDDHGHEVLREGIVTREMVHQLLEGRRILFVCTGNTCRSPMAAEIFRRQLAARLGKSPEDLNELGYRILSAGTFAHRGGRASEYAEVVAKERGGDLSSHISQPLTRELLADVDRVIALGHSHYGVIEELLEDLPLERRPRLEMLSAAGIMDPVGSDLETYRGCAAEIAAAIERLLPK